MPQQTVKQLRYFCLEQSVGLAGQLPSMNPTCDSRGFVFVMNKLKKGLLIHFVTFKQVSFFHHLQSLS